MSRTARQIGQQIEVVLKSIADLPPLTIREVGEEIALAYYAKDYSGPLDEHEFIEDCQHWSDTWTEALKPEKKVSFLDGPDFGGADLRGADLRGADLSYLSRAKA